MVAKAETKVKKEVAGTKFRIEDEVMIVKRKTFNAKEDSSFILNVIGSDQLF